MRAGERGFLGGSRHPLIDAPAHENFGHVDTNGVRFDQHLRSRRRRRFDIDVLEHLRRTRSGHAYRFHRGNIAQVQRLIVCFDGTWNTPEDHTNIARIYSAIADASSGCRHQLKFYDPGVGTAADDQFMGGVIGWGLDRNILEGYCWLINQYAASGTRAGEDGEEFDAGPDVFIFGFSRGAYTARSLGGLMNRCGILKSAQFASEPQGLAHPDAPLVREAWLLYRRKFSADVESRYEPECVDFRRRHSWNAKVKFIGVWDTVGALGVPMFSNSVLARAKYGFHDTALGRVVENAFHAVAIDEQREDYAATLWTTKRHSQNVAQRWFPGAHANVGGGYEGDHLPEPPMAWIAGRAMDVGLEFKHPIEFRLRGNEHLLRSARFVRGVHVRHVSISAVALSAWPLPAADSAAGSGGKRGRARRI